MIESSPNFTSPIDIPGTKEYNPLLVSADNFNLASGDSSWLDSAHDALTYGAKGAWTSMVNSFQNTGIEVANWFGAGLDKVDTYSELQQSGDINAANYYAQHQTGVDLAGFLVGSLLPGIGGLKALQVAKKGTGLIPEALGLFSNRREALIKDTLNLIKQGTPSVDAVLRANKYKVIAYGVADQAIQATAWETAVIATMGQSPTLDNQDWKDITLNMGIGALIGGAVGGIWDAFGAQGLYKKAQLIRDVTNRVNEATTNLGKGDFIPGDRVVELLDSMEKIPLPPTPEASKTVQATYNKAIDTTKILLGKIAPDSEVANSLFDRLLKARDEGGLTQEDLYMMLSGATKIQRVGFDDVQSTPVFYVRKALDEKENLFQNPITNDPVLGKAQAYKLKNEQIKPKISTNAQFDTAGDAFKNGSDIWLDESGVPHVNPKSENIQKALRPGFTNVAKTEGAPLIVNLRSGVVSDTAVPVIGDLAPSGEIKLVGGGKSLQVGDSVYSYNSNFVKDLYGDDHLAANGRYVWAARRGIKSGDVIDINDLATMDALTRTVAEGTLDEKVAASISLKDSAGVVKSFKEFSTSNKLQDTVEEAKRSGLNSYLSTLGKEPNSNGLPLGKDLRELSARFNVSQSWLEAGLPKVTSLDQISPNPELWAVPNYAKVIYDVGNPVKDIDGMVAREMPAVLGRISRAKDLAQNVWMTYAKDFDRFFPTIDPRWNQMNVNSLGSGPSALGFTNADYAVPGEMWEAVGAQVHKVKLDKIQTTLDSLSSPILKIANSAPVAAELGVITNVLRGSAEKYVLIPDSNYMVLKQLLPYTQKAQFGTVTKLGFKKEAEALLPKDYSLRIAGDQGEEILQKGKYAAYKLSGEVSNFLADSTAANDKRLIHHNNFLTAQGISKQFDLGNIYAPPIDTKKYNYWALVREPQGNGASSSSVASITAVNEGELATKIALAKESGYEVFTKDDIKRHHQVLGDYDYNMNMVENRVDSELKKKGVLSDFYPETRADRVLDDWTTWHQNQETRLLRNMVELKYAQQFAEMRDLGDSYTALATSRAGKVTAFTGKTAENPYDDYIKTALDLSKTAEYRMWSDSNEKVEAFFDSAFRFAKQTFFQARSGQISFEEANATAQKYGMGQPFVTAASYLESQGMLAPKPYIREFVQKINSLMSMTTLRLDSMQALINTISTPILLGHEVSSLKRYFGNPEGLKRLAELTSTELPGDATKRIPATVKLVYNAVNNYFSPAGKQLLDEYSKSGLELSLLRQQQEMLGSLQFTGKEDAATLTKMFNKAATVGENLSGNKFAESFTRFVSADVMRQITDALGVEDAGVRLAMMRTFVNRVQGNYIASQRPIAFQGVIGQAIGLFQTYQFNLMQQVFRSIEGGDKKSLAVLFGLQGTLYGLNGLPLFNALNTHIVGNAIGNPTHTDVTTAVPSMVGKDVGNFLLYGGASWFTNAALYSRGDINPRQITVLPILPRDWPAVSGVTKFVQNLFNIGEKLNDGGNFVQTMLQGLEHNSLSRPLAGLAQVAQGYSTTSSGDLISRTNEVSAISNAARMLGAKPLDEAIALDALYRKDAYKAKDTQRIKQLGEAVKTTLIAGGTPSEEELNHFATEYAASGGRIDYFNKFFVDAMKNSSQSNVNRFMQQIRNPVAQNMMTIMGGEELPDYTNLGATR